MAIAITKMKPKTIADRIRCIRGHRSQSGLADILNSMKMGRGIPKSSIAQPMISRYEQGVDLPNPFVLLRLARLGGTTIDWILTGHRGGA